MSYHCLSVVHDCLSFRLQLELSSRLELERLEASLVETTAAKQRLSDQLAAAQQVIGELRGCHGWDHPVASAAAHFLATLVHKLRVPGHVRWLLSVQGKGVQ
jgi:hypothetical protein